MILEVSTCPRKKTLYASFLSVRMVMAIKIHLAEILEEKNISLNQLSFRTEMQRTQLRNYRDNKIQRLDIDILKRLCYVLECSLTDLIEYIPPEEI